MSAIVQPQPAKLIVGMLSCERSLFEEIEVRLENMFGKIEIKSHLIPFGFTDYYTKDMGRNILRMFFSFKNSINPGEIASIKVLTNELEDTYRQNSIYPNKRPVNLDPGYLTHAKLILASTKDYYHRIYLGKGIYAEVTLYYKEGKFENLPWTYPDYQTEEYKDFFVRVRKLLTEHFTADTRGNSSHAKDIGHH